MTQEQFFNLMRNPQSAGDISTKELVQLVEQFPYSTPLRFIYLKQLKEQNSVHYNQQLKLTSIYSPDRSRLFNYVHENARVEMEILSDVLPINEINSEPKIETKEIEIAPPVTVDEEEFFSEEVINETSVQPVLKVEQEEIIVSNENEEPSLQDIINQRLRELNIMQDDDSHLPVLPIVEDYVEEEVISGHVQTPEVLETSQILPEPVQLLEQEAKEITPIQTFEVSENSKVLEDDSESQSETIQTSQTTSNKEEAISSNEILIDELILENLAESQFYKTELLLNENEDPEVNQVYPQKRVTEDLEIPVQDDSLLQSLDMHTNTPHSFIEWLKIAKRTPVPSLAKSEEKPSKATEPSQPIEKKQTPVNDLIDKFIKQEPRITPSRSTFYSPVNMARNSVKEDDELVSETLAKIYATQGNLQKAIASYEKLLLKYPEKKTYFAPLIKNLKEKLNS